jgi:hypothetical protein
MDDFSQSLLTLFAFRLSLNQFEHESALFEQMDKRIKGADKGTLRVCLSDVLFGGILIIPKLRLGCFSFKLSQQFPSVLNVKIASHLCDTACQLREPYMYVINVYHAINPLI